MSVATAPVEVRPADAFADWEGLLGLLRRAFAFMEGRIDPPSSLRRLDAPALARKAAEERLFLAWREGTLAGCAFFAVRPGALYIGKLAVEPALHGQGIGRALMAAAEAEARKRGLAALELQTRVELIENHAAFARMGFSRTGLSAHPGYDRPTTVEMRKELR